MQFRLRTMFIAIAVCAVVCAFPAASLVVLAMLAFTLTYLILPFAMARALITGYTHFGGHKD